MTDIFPAMGLKHKHKHYFSTSKKEFEPVDPSLYRDIPELADQEVYVMKEYAIYTCNSPCLNTIKVEVKKEIIVDE